MQFIQPAYANSKAGDFVEQTKSMLLAFCYSMQPRVGFSSLPTIRLGGERFQRLARFPIAFADQKTYCILALILCAA
jgi:hypothetical protein